MFHVLGPDGEHDPLFEMKLRDQYALETARFGACEDDCEVRSPLDDHREGEDAFLSRPLRIASEYALEWQRQLDEVLRLGFDFSMVLAHGDYLRKQGDHALDARFNADGYETSVHTSPARTGIDLRAR